MSLDTKVSLEVKPRQERGKNATRRLRASGLVPVTIYGGNQEAASTMVVRREFSALLRAHGRNKVFTLNFEGTATPAKLVDLQLDPVKGTLMHADFIRISLTEKTTFDLPIKIVGESEGVKLHGGILEVVIHSLEIRCLPLDLPESVEVDVSGLGLGDHLSVKDLKVGDQVEVLTDSDTVVATVVAPRAEEEVTPAADASAEPEVIKKGKGDEKSGE
ncbi:MAG TPA: 50S ribosomal protein L25 [Blastocatellia bacterium]|nr:50S ribosomal protein L25 [Blastocatellia bacterium]